MELSTIGNRKQTIYLAVFLVLAMISSAFAAGDPNKEIMDQVNKVAPTEEQLEEFRRVFKEYYRQRKDASRRAMRNGGDVAVKVTMKLDKISVNSIESMSKVLTEEQLEEYKVLLAIANGHFLASAGLD